MNIAMLAAGAGGMYCGSCMRDNALAAGLKRRGHAVTLIPLYTPLRTDERDVSIDEVFFGGVNVYLRQAGGLFGHLPRPLTWLLDRPWLLRSAGWLASSAKPEKLGSLTVGVLSGEHGPQAAEIDRLLDFLRREVRPDVLVLPNAMFLGLAGPLRRELSLPVLCQLTGEDIFLDQLPEPHRGTARQLIREAAAGVDAWAATSRYYANHMAAYLALPPGRIDVVYPGVAVDDFPAAPPAHPPGRPNVVGYMARVCPAKGLNRLIDAMIALRRRPNMCCVQARAAGWLAPSDRDWFDAQVQRVVDSELAGGFTYVGEVDRAGKLELLGGIDLLCVPTDYPEAKGIYVLEALAAGVPVVQPDHGSFRELIDATGGGILVPPGDSERLADGLAELLGDPARRAALGAAGQAAVRANFTIDVMASRMSALLDRTVQSRGRQV